MLLAIRRERVTGPPPGVVDARRLPGVRRQGVPHRAVPMRQRDEVQVVLRALKRRKRDLL